METFTLHKQGNRIEFTPNTSTGWIDIVAYNKSGKCLFTETKPAKSARMDWQAYKQTGFKRDYSYQLTH